MTRTKLFFQLKALKKRIWFRAFTYALAGVGAAIVGLFAGPWVPTGIATKIGSDSVGGILSILASSMLTVATFSLSIMVTAYGYVASGATPRASRLLIENQSAQSAIATFIGGFLYAIVAIVALATKAYGEEGRFVLFVATVLVIFVIVVTLIRWVDQLSHLGRVGHTIAQIEEATLATLRDRAEKPRLGGAARPSAFDPVEGLQTRELGFLAFANVEALQSIAEREEIQIALELLPGAYVYPNRPLASASRTLTPEVRQEILSHFVLERSRTFDQDPRFGLVLLSEIASRALSPGINDAGTAIEVIGSATRVLSAWTHLQRESSQARPLYSRVFVPDIQTADMVGDVFAPIARDGAGLVEVGIKLARALSALENFGAPDGSDAYARLRHLLWEHARGSLKTDTEKDRLRRLLKPRD